MKELMLGNAAVARGLFEAGGSEVYYTALAMQYFYTVKDSAAYRRCLQASGFTYRRILHAMVSIDRPQYRNEENEHGTEDD